MGFARIPRLRGILANPTTLKLGCNRPLGEYGRFDACVVVTQLQNEGSESAKKINQILIRLSARQMKHGVESTSPALLAGYMVLLAMTDNHESPDLDLGELKRIRAKVRPFALV